MSGLSLNLPFPQSCRPAIVQICNLQSAICNSEEGE